MIKHYKGGTQVKKHTNLEYEHRRVQNGHIQLININHLVILVGLLTVP